MQKIFLLILLLSVFTTIFAQTIEPIERKIGKLTISIDPRMEILGAVQITADYPIVNKNNTYSKKVEAYFKPYVSLEAISVTKQLTDNFAYDAPVTFMLHLSQADKLKQVLPYNDDLITRAQGTQNLQNYRIALKDFTAQSDFKKFWNQNLLLYNQILDLTVSESSGIDWVKTLEDYYNESQNSYNIIITPSFRGGYGPRLPGKNGKWDIYACMSPGNTEKENIPYLDKNSLMFYIWHEFSHSFVNPTFEKHQNRIDSTAKLFEPLASVMKQQAYDDWTTCVNEHIVRAVHLRLIDLHIGKVAYHNKLNAEFRNQFVYIEPLVEKLKEYENLRKSKHITFSEFAPTLLHVFDSLANSNYQQLSEFKFRGPINSAFQNKVAIIYPTNDKDSIIQNQVKEYARMIYDRIFKSQGLFIADTVALKSQLSDLEIVTYGTIQSNLFLEHYKSLLPFSITDNKIIADRMYQQAGIKMISCMPNPQNQKFGMVVYTATSNKDVIDINNVYHGQEDYIIFTNRDNVITRGNYSSHKSCEKWAFIE